MKRIDKYNHLPSIRYVARFKIETTSALRIGTGEKGGEVENPIVRDANGLPYIPGSSLAGIIRHALEEQFGNDIKSILGFQERLATNDSRSEREKSKARGGGSRLFFSPALLVSSDDKTVHEGLEIIQNRAEHAYYKSFDALTQRDNVAIDHKGAAKEHAKFDTQLVYKGTRFMFELELAGNSDDEQIWNNIIHYIQDASFRIGGGTRKGFGAIKIVENGLKCVKYNLTNRPEMKDYLAKSSSLKKSLKGGEVYKSKQAEQQNISWETKRIALQAENFFLFASGEEVAQPKKEQYFVWGKNGAELREGYLIPATSIKGALAHRTAFHYNRLAGIHIGDQAVEDSTNFDIEAAVQHAFPQTLESIEQLNFSPDSENWDELIAEIENLSPNDTESWKDLQMHIATLEATALPIGENNTAVSALFGIAKQSTPENYNQLSIEEQRKFGSVGKIVFSDVYLSTEKEEVQEKIFNHVAIDRYTGGHIDGALFSARTLESEQLIGFDMSIETTAFEGEQGENVRDALEAALHDLQTGHLQLGGQSTKGHGVFKKAKV